MILKKKYHKSERLAQYSQRAERKKTYNQEFLIQ